MAQCGAQSLLHSWQWATASCASNTRRSPKPSKLQIARVTDCKLQTNERTFGSKLPNQNIRARGPLSLRVDVKKINNEPIFTVCFGCWMPLNTEYQAHNMTPKYGISGWTRAFRLFLKQTQSHSKNKVKLVGEDYLGNKYFEANRPNHSRPVQRYFDTAKPVDSFSALTEAAHVPPAWDAWLRFRRQDPPTDEEVRDSVEYYQMQQEKAASEKKEETPVNPREREMETIYKKLNSRSQQKETI